MSKRRCLAGRAIGVVGWLLIGTLFAQQRPLQTDDPETLASGRMRTQLGFEYLQNQTFTLSGLQGDLTRLGVLGLFVGAGPRAEFQVTGTLVNTLDIESRLPAFNSGILNFQGNSTSSVGDFTLASKFLLFQERSALPAIGFRFGVEMPNASNESGLGNDQTNFHAGILVGKSFGRWRALGNIGLAILGDPTTVSAQNDLLTYGAALSCDLSPRWALVGELQGRAGPGGPGTDEQALLRLGARIRTGNFRWDVAGMAGLRDTDPSSGVVLGISYEFNAFRTK